MGETVVGIAVLRRVEECLARSSWVRTHSPLFDAVRNGPSQGLVNYLAREQPDSTCNAFWTAAHTRANIQRCQQNPLGDLMHGFA